MLALAFADLTPILLLGIVLQRFGTVAGWTWPQLALLYGLSQTASSLARSLTVGLDHFEEFIVNGTFDVLLVRPLSPLLQVVAGHIELVHAGRVAIGLLVLSAAFSAAGVPVTATNLALATSAVLGGALILASLTLAVAALTFWLTRTGKLQDIFQGATRAFAEFPLAIYPRGIRFVLTWLLPLALCTYFPARELLGRGGGPVAYAALPAGAVLGGLALLLWRAGLRRYQSTGS